MFLSAECFPFGSYVFPFRFELPQDAPGEVYPLQLSDLVIISLVPPFPSEFYQIFFFSSACRSTHYFTIPDHSQTPSLPPPFSSLLQDNFFPFLFFLFLCGAAWHSG